MGSSDTAPGLRGRFISSKAMIMTGVRSGKTRHMPVPSEERKDSCLKFAWARACPGCGRFKKKASRHKCRKHLENAQNC